jgi:hypothetical protein
MRSKRVLALVLVAFVIGAVAEAPAGAAAPTRHQARVWQRACVGPAHGEISPQPALVCVHNGFPMFDSAALGLLRDVCEGRLGGSFVYRSEFPVELAACFFD